MDLTNIQAPIEWNLKGEQAPEVLWPVPTYQIIFLSVEDTDVGFLAANEIRNTNKLKLYIEGNDERMTLISVFDNLGKGASGAAVQNMNLVLGLPETTGLI